MNIELSDLLSGTITLVVLIAACLFWPLALRYVRSCEHWLRAAQLRHDLINYVLVARQLYETHPERVDYILSLIEKRYPDLDTEHLKTSVEAVFVWVENNLDLDLFLGKTEGKE